MSEYPITELWCVNLRRESGTYSVFKCEAEDHGTHYVIREDPVWSSLRVLPKGYDEEPANRRYATDPHKVFCRALEYVREEIESTREEISEARRHINHLLDMADDLEDDLRRAE